MPSPTRRPRDPDPLVAARLQAISYADPYVFVHAEDVDPQPLNYQAFSADEDVGGWVPDPPIRRPPVPPRMSPPPPPSRVPASPVRARLDEVRQRLELAGGGLLALLVLGFLAAGAAVVFLIRAQPHATSLPLPAVSSPVVHTSTVAAGPTSSSAATVLTVDVTGKVHHPGVYRLSAGARVLDAVRAAGGALPKTSLDTLNLAAKVTDGQQVAVGAPAAAVAAVGTGAAGATQQPAVVDLNTATVEQLQTLPGIGPVLAQHIVDYRTQHGPYPSVDALQQVSGIGPSKFAQLKDHVSA